MREIIKGQYERNRVVIKLNNLEKKFVEEKILCDAFPDRDKTKLNDIKSQIIEVNETLKTFS